MSKDRIYKIVFFNQGNVVELYARQVGQGDLAAGGAEMGEAVYWRWKE